MEIIRSISPFKIDKYIINTEEDNLKTPANVKKLKKQTSKSKSQLAVLLEPSKENNCLMSKSFKNIPNVRIKLNYKRRSSTADFISNKGSFVRENSNFISDNFSLFDKDHMFFKEENKDKDAASFFNNINKFDITNPHSLNSSLINKENEIINDNKSPILPKKSQNKIIEFKLLLENTAKKLNKNQCENIENSFSKSSINNVKNYVDNSFNLLGNSIDSNKTPANKSNNKSVYTNKHSAGSIISNISKNKILNKIKPIETTSKTTETNSIKNTIKSTKSTYKAKQTENASELFREFELFLKKNSSAAKRNKDKVLGYTNSNNKLNNDKLNLKNKFNLNKYKYVFSDVNSKNNTSFKYKSFNNESYSNTQTGEDKNAFDNKKLQNIPISKNQGVTSLGYNNYPKLFI